VREKVNEFKDVPKNSSPSPEAHPGQPGRRRPNGGVAASLTFLISVSDCPTSERDEGRGPHAQEG